MKIGCLFFLAATIASASAANPTAFDAIEQIRSEFGDSPLEGIVEMTGTKGEPQPEEWWLLSYDARNPFKLHYYWADNDRATDEGFNDDLYKKDAPEGFIRFDRLKLDSGDAFRRADAEATKVGIDFDRIDYRLHCREYSDEPVWTMKLFNRSFYVGRLDISGGDGTVLRAVWLQYSTDSPRGGVEIMDTAFPGAAGPALVAGIDPVPPVAPIDPAPIDPPVSPLPPTTPDPDPEPPTPVPTTPDDEYPVATAVAGRPGYVRSPFKPEAGLVDVQGLKSGTPAHCPYTGKIFRVP